MNRKYFRRLKDRWDVFNGETPKSIRKVEEELDEVLSMVVMPRTAEVKRNKALVDEASLDLIEEFPALHRIIELFDDGDDESAQFPEMATIRAKAESNDAKEAAGGSATFPWDDHLLLPEILEVYVKFEKAAKAKRRYGMGKAARLYDSAQRYYAEKSREAAAILDARRVEALEFAESWCDVHHTQLETIERETRQMMPFAQHQQAKRRLKEVTKGKVSIQTSITQSASNVENKVTELLERVPPDFLDNLNALLTMMVNNKGDDRLTEPAAS